MPIAETWTFLAGLGMFLLGMTLVEGGLREMTGASFRKFLREHTRHPAEAILVGILVTAVLQSSSLVTLMLLALTGAGVMSLRNALGVVIGANLGTTFTGWIVTTLGFKLNLDQLAMPLVGLGCIGYVFLEPGRKLHHWFTFGTGLGFLFLGLGYMKTSAEGLAGVVDISLLADYGLLVFLLFGFVLTAIIQSSSACMMIVLSAVHAGIIDLPMAAAVVIGADLGTTVTTILGSLKGNAVKRQVALAHVLYNVVTDAIAFVMIHPLLDIITNTLGITDPLYGTVAFHSSFNIVGILIFYPMLGHFAAFLERRFISKETHAATFLHRVPMQASSLYVEAMRRDLATLVVHSLQYNRNILDLPEMSLQRLPKAPEYRLRDWPGRGPAYDFLKDLQGEILAAAIAVQELPLAETDSIELERVISSARAAVHCAKSIKDIEHNLNDCKQSAVADVQQFLHIAHNELAAFYRLAEDCMQSANPEARREAVQALRRESEATNDRLWTAIRAVLRSRNSSDIEVATLNSMNRELYSSGKSLADALAALLPATEISPQAP